MALVTYLPRVLPMMLLSSRRLNPWLERWLSMVPPTVIAAILAQELLIQKKDGMAFISLGPDNVFLLAAVPAFLVSWFTKSFMGTVASGMAAVAALRYLAVT